LLISDVNLSSPPAAVGKAVNGLLIVQALRPDRLTAMARLFVEKVLGSTFAHAADKELDLAGIVEGEVCHWTAGIQ